MTKIKQRILFEDPDKYEWDIEFDGAHNIRGNINKFTRNGKTQYQIIVHYGVSWLYNTVVDTFEEAKNFFDKYEHSFRGIDKQMRDDLFVYEMKLVEKHKKEVTEYIEEQKFNEYFTLK